MKLKVTFCLLVAVLLIPLQANAQTNVSGTDSADLMRLKRDQLKENIGELKQSFRERRQETREVIQARREQFREGLRTIRDVKKKLAVERIDTRMASANKKTTIRLASVLERIQTILNKIIEKAGLAKAKGVDTTALDTATVSAQIAVDNAKAIVTSQSGMVYVMQIATESALRENVGSTVSELRLDLRDAHKAVIDAKQAVMKAEMELAKLKRDRPVRVTDENLKPSATGSSF